jgi:hypothetical protein
MVTLLESLPDLLVVVYLAVMLQHEFAVATFERLGAAFAPNDRKPRMAQDIASAYL